MNKTFKLLCVLLAVVILATMTACGSVNMEEELLLKNKTCEIEPQEAAASELVDPENVYSSLEYTTEMFYGNYRSLDFESFDNSESDLKKFCEQVGYMDYTPSTYYGKLSALPYAFRTGPESDYSSLKQIKGYNWAKLLFASEKGMSCTVYCAFEVKGNQLVVKPLRQWTKDSDTGEISYEFEEGVELSYTFSRKAFMLTLSSGGHDVVMYNSVDSRNEYRYFYCSVCPSTPEDSLFGVDKICLSYDQEESYSSAYYVLENDEKQKSNYVPVKMTADGRLTVTGIANEETKETFCKQFAFLFCGSDGIILFDGNRQYRYQLDSYTRKMAALQDFVEIEDESEGSKTELSDEQIAALVEKKDSLIADLGAAFEQAGLSVRVDEASGEMAMDADILFDGDSAVLKDEGKELLDKFIGAYATVVNDEKYKGFVATTRVEGHTAPVSGVSFEAGMPLSKERANVVKDYCAAAPNVGELAASMEAIGMSNGSPIVDGAGNVDMAASRRVAFRFLINLH